MMLDSEDIVAYADSCTVSRTVPARAWWFGHAVMLIPMLSALLKLADLSEFRVDLQTWTVFPDAVLSAGVFVIPLTELAIGLVWYLGLARHRALEAWAVCLVLFSIALGIQMFWGKPPDCGCFGVIDRYFANLGGVPWLLSRNAVLFILTIGCWYWLRAGAGQAPLGSR